jgi:hypothetical protein
LRGQPPIDAYHAAVDGLPGRIQVAERTRELLRDGHRFEKRLVEVKGTAR